jgi:hypothetical protein
MKKIQITGGIIWAFLCLILIIILFPGLNSFSASASKLPFMKINPNYTGGEVADRFISPGCTLVIRKPVFDGLFRERKKGFVQLDWRGNIPEKIVDTIDYNFDGVPDFGIMIKKADLLTSLDPLNTKIGNVLISSPTSFGWSLRVTLVK